MKIRFARSALLVVPALLLAACGGGGGGSSSGTPVASQIVITSSNQQAVAAEALQATTNTQTASVGSGLITGVSVDGDVPGANGLPLAGAARKLLTMIPAPGAVATGVTQTQSANCSLGGSISVTATFANPNSTVLQTNDAVSITANNCVENVDGANATLNGTMAVTVVKGPYDPNSSVYPKSVTLKIVATKFSLSESGTTTVSNGDLTMSIVENSATNESLSLSSTELSTTVSTSGGSHTLTLKNYSHNIVVTGTSGATVSMSATVETNNSRLGSGLLTYDISTPTALQLDANGIPTAGSIKVVGKSSAALLTVNTSTSYTLQLDANGDGTYESTSTVTRAQLLALL